MTDTLVVENWGKFQHYKDRNPPWIKLHTSLLDDYDFQRLPGNAKWQLLLIWLVAARQDNRIPDDREWLASLLRTKEDDLEVDLLVDRGWLKRSPAPSATVTDSASAGRQALSLSVSPGACARTTEEQLKAKTESNNARARENEFADQF